jgi:hypothetical protein
MKILLKIFLPAFVILIGPFFSVFQTQEQQEQDHGLIDSLKPFAVYNDDFVRDTFYTWTSTKQIKGLQSSKILLSKSKSETKGYTLFDVSIRDSTLNGNPFAEMLKSAQFEKKRFAWINGWATVMGWKDENYGDQLIRIVLKRDAIIGYFNKNKSGNKFQFFDLNKKNLSSEYVLQNKNRVAVIYHVNTKKGVRTEHRGTFQRKNQERETNIDFREYVIVNESMIQEWSSGTKEIENEMKAEINLLKRLSSSQKYNQTSYYYYDNNFADLNRIDDPNINSLFVAMKCFNNDYYMFNNKRLDAITKKMKSVFSKQMPPLSKKYD